MALITFAELLTVKPEADQLSLCALPTMRVLGALITGGAARGGGRGALQSRRGGKEMGKR